MNPTIDLGLAVLSATARNLGVVPRLTSRDIADVCDCSYQYIWQVEQRSLRKLRQALRARGQFEEIHQAVTEHHSHSPWPGL